MKGDIVLGPMTVAMLLQTGDMAILRAVMDYRATGAEPVGLAVWPTIREEEIRRAELSAKRSSAGRAGYFAKANSSKIKQNKAKVWQNQANQPSRAQEETSSLISHAQENSPLERNTDTTVSVKERPAPLAHHADESAPAPVSEEPASPPPTPPPQPADFALTSEPTPKQAKPRKRFEAPTVEMVTAYCAEKGYPSSIVDPDNFVNYHAANGWMIGKNPMKDWKAAVRYWASRHSSQGPPARQPDPRSDPTKFYTGTDYYDRIAEAHGLTYSSSPFTGKPQEPQPPSPPPPNVF